MASSRDLNPWRHGEGTGVRRYEENPFLSLHREMNRLFDETFRGAPGFESAERGLGWPNIEIDENDSEVKVIAELPGMEERDIDVELAGGVLAIKGEKKSEVEDKERRFSERYFGRFERRIPVEGVDVDKVAASFKNGVLTVTLPKTQQARSQIKHIAINGH